MDTLHTTVLWIARLSLASLALGLLAGGRLRRVAFEGIDRRLLFAMCLLAAGLMAIKPLVPHTIWHEQHAVEIVVQVEARQAEGGMEALHGPGYPVVMKTLHRIFFGRLSVFSVNYLISIGSVLLMFLLMRLAFAQTGPALAAASLLGLLATHLRLAATEDTHILVEFLSLLSLFLLLLFQRTGRRLPFGLALLALLLLMYTRAEMMLLAPLVAAAWVLSGLDGRRLLRLAQDPGIWACLLAAAALCVPRAVEIVRLADPRIRQFLPPSDMLQHYKNLGLQGISPFFNPEFTPAVYLVLLVLGLVGLFKDNRRAFLFWNFQWLLMTYYYSTHLSCLSLKIRTAMASQFALVAIAAYGFHFVTRSLGSRNRIFAHLLLHGCLLVGLWNRRDFLTTLFTKQQEYGFLTAMVERLPSTSGLVYLSQADDPDLIQNREYQKHLVDFLANRTGKRVLLVGARQFLKAQEKGSLGRCYFYKGVACYTLPRTRSRPVPPAEMKDPVYVHPLCRQIQDTFLLEPVQEATVGSKSHSWDAIEGDARTIGLYRILPVGDSSAERPRAAEGEPEIGCGSATLPGRGVYLLGRSAELSLRAEAALLRAVALFERGSLREGFHEYNKAAEPFTPEVLAAIRRYCQDRGHLCDPLERAQQGMDRLIEEGVRLLKSGQRQPALERFDRALAINPEDVSALLNRGFVAAVTGDFGSALRYYDAVIRQRPSGRWVLPDALSARADALARMGRRREAVADLERSLNQAPADWPRRAQVRAELDRFRKAADAEE